ncbi:hypothetical protein, partial [Oceanibium sediminis]|uniref:hypothetical protein n=1 Tax=Oceanibium sediminis TaxID=2026339 RepID=UPI001E4FBE22
FQVRGDTRFLDLSDWLRFPCFFYFSGLQADFDIPSFGKAQVQAGGTREQLLLSERPAFLPLSALLKRGGF